MAECCPRSDDDLEMEPTLVFERPAPTRLLSSIRRGRLLPLCALLVLSGCGGQSAQVTVGSVDPTDSKGVIASPITSIPHGTTQFFEVILNDDIEGLGADWTVTCSSSAPEGSLPAGTIDTSCGTFAPYHTASGPVPSYPATGILTQYTAPSMIPKGGTVTIVVHATSRPAANSSVTLTVT